MNHLTPLLKYFPILCLLIIPNVGFATQPSTTDGTATMENENPSSQMAAKPESSDKNRSVDTKNNKSKKSLGINMDLLVATNFVFRGWNTFQNGSQMDQHMFAAPGLTWSVGDTGLSFGYWGAFQFVGDNVMDNVDNGINFEHDLIVAYTKPLLKNLKVTGMVTIYLFPHCDKTITGASVPTWVEPTIIGNLSLSSLDLGLFTSYFYGVQQEPGIRDGSYMYFNPSLGKTLKILQQPIDFKMGYGFKLFKEGNSNRANIHDFQLTAATAFNFGEWYVKPGVGISWTDMGKDSTGSSIDADKGMIVWAWVNVGSNK
jgi:hypothetical protein